MWRLVEPLPLDTERPFNSRRMPTLAIRIGRLAAEGLREGVMATFGYVRVSSDGQEDGTSLDEQRARIAAFAVARGWGLSSVFADIASGTSFARPQFQALEAALNPGDSVVVLALSRFSRTLTDGYPRILAWQERNIALYSVTEPIETSSAMGRHMLRMVFDFAQTEREVLLERIAAGRLRNADRGGWNGGPVPFGYRRAPTGAEVDFVIEPVEAAIVREVFRDFATGRWGMAKLIKRTGCPLSPAAVEGMLRNVFYTGRVAYSGTVRMNRHEAIVSDRLFNRVQAIRAERARSPSVGFFKVVEGKGEVRPFHPAR